MRSQSSFQFWVGEAAPESRLQSSILSSTSKASTHTHQSLGLPRSPGQRARSVASDSLHPKMLLLHFTHLSILLAFAAQAKANIVTTEFNVSQVPTDVTVNTTFPPFANLGGPVRHESPAHPPPTTRSPTHPHARFQADLTGSLYQQESGYIGMITPSGFTSSLYLGEYRITPHATDSLSLSHSHFARSPGDGQYMLQMGRFLSWECTGVPGEYRATVMCVLNLPRRLFPAPRSPRPTLTHPIARRASLAPCQSSRRVFERHNRRRQQVRERQGRRSRFLLLDLIDDSLP